MTKTNRCLCLNIPFLGYRCFQNKTLDTKSSSPTGIKTKFYLKRWEGFMLNVFTGQYSLRKEVHKFHDKGNTEDRWHYQMVFVKRNLYRQFTHGVQKEWRILFCDGLKNFQQLYTSLAFCIGKDPFPDTSATGHDFKTQISKIVVLSFLLKKYIFIKVSDWGEFTQIL